MADFVKLEQQFLAHDLQRANLLGILLLGQKYLAIATLSDLCKNLEVTLSESHPSLAEIGSLSTGILVPHMGEGLFVGIRREGVFGLESIESVLAVANVGEEVEVIVEKVWSNVQSVLKI